MLKLYAQDMYAKGVRNEELLLIKVKPDIAADFIDRQHIGNTTSFFNQDKEGKEKKIKNLVEQVIDLTETEEIQKAREIFDPDEMLRIWNQFFTGTYVVNISQKKKAENVDKEDGLEAEYEINNILDEKDKDKLLRDENLTAAQMQKYEDGEEMFAQDRTMDRYEQIHFFFEVMIEHNVKTLKSCDALKKPSIDKKNEAPKLGNLSAKADEKTAAMPQVDLEEDEDEEALASRNGNSKKTKFERYDDVLELVIEEEERLPLWMLMSKEEKLDMLAHECIDSEAQIMSFLIEFEYGAENNYKKEGKNLHLDQLLESSLNQMIYQKYLAYTRLQAAFYARTYTQDMILKTQKRSIELYNYAEYLFDLNTRLAKRERENKKKSD